MEVNIPKDFKRGKMIYDPPVNILSSVQLLSSLYDQYNCWDKTLKIYYAGTNGKKESKEHDWYVQEVMAKEKRFKTFLKE